MKWKLDDSFTIIFGDYKKFFFLLLTLDYVCLDFLR